MIVVAESVHVLAALTWAGAVVAAGLVLSIRTGEVGRVRALLLRRFGFLAAGCVAVAALTGSYLAGYRITRRWTPSCTPATAGSCSSS